MDWTKNRSINKARSTSKYCCVEFLPQTTIRKRSSNPRAGGPQRDLWKNHLTKKIWVWNSISSRPLFSQICWPFDNRRPLEQEKRKIVNNKNENSGRKISQCVASVSLSAVQWPFRQKISSAKNWVSNQIKSQDRNFPIWCKEPLFWLEAGLKISLFFDEEKNSSKALKKTRPWFWADRIRAAKLCFCPDSASFYMKKNRQNIWEARVIE